MPYLKFFLLTALVSTIICQAQVQLPVSNCLNNCYGCKATDPLNCATVVDNSINRQVRCVPYYSGDNCSIGGSFYNMYDQSGVLNNFVNWSQPSKPASQTCTVTGGGSVSGIGPFSSTLNATKMLQFTAAQGVKRMLIKIGVGVSDSQLLQQTSQNSTQNVQFVTINGTLFQITTNTTTNTATRTIPFVTLQARDLVSNNAIIKSQGSGYRTASPSQTQCGFIYQYQFVITTNSASFQQVMLNFFLPPASATLWWLFDFKVEVGCSGFAVGVNCDSCLTGFYPALTLSGSPNGCKHCHYNCSTCGNNGVCISCQNYASQNTVTKSCSFPSDYMIYNTSRSYNVVRGSLINTTSSFFTQIYRSQARQLSIDFTLRNSQSYLLKFYIIFPASYVDNNALIKVTIDGQTWDIAFLNKNRAMLSDINGGTSQLFVLPYKIDRMGSNTVTGSSQIVLQLQGTTIVDEFYLADPVIIQYQCSPNCMNCSFSLTQTVTCQQCQAFFSKDKNCLTCANGFYLQTGGISRCVKCYSNCKQCRTAGSYSCTECFDRFGLMDYSFHSRCIQSIVSEFSQKSNNVVCVGRPTLNSVTTNQNCSICLSSKTSQYYSDNYCLQCWIALGYVWGRCGPLMSGGLSFYASEAVHQQGALGWQGPPQLTSYTCTSDYTNIVGVPNIANNTNNTNPTKTQISTTFVNLPTHYGLYFVINIFKVDFWAVPNTVNTNSSSTVRLTPLNITITVGTSQSTDLSFVVSLNNDFGANICGQSSKQMIMTLPAYIVDHSASAVTIRITAPDKGIFVSDLELYLGNCDTCSLVGLTYSLFFLPVYSQNNTQTGIDSFVTFNKPISFNNGSSSTQDNFARSFSYKVNNVDVASIVKDSSYLTDPNYRYIKHFLPLSQSSTNATVTATTKQPDLIYAQDGSIRRQLITNTLSHQLQRYVDSTSDTRRSIGQLSDFFLFFTWFTLITMIICVGLGVGVIFQQFSQMMQIIFYHIYITSWLLPPTIKVPLAHANRMEHLNYFINNQAIEDNLFSLTPKIPSNYIFLQFNIDVYFLRSIYPILIINAIFIGWFIILKIIEVCVSACKNSQNKVIRFLRSVPARPMAYFDQIWRYQFLAVMWACMLQFTDFQGQGGQVVNLVICILAFTISLLWPFVVTIYIYRRHFTTNAKHFLYLYHDLMYLKTTSLCNEPKSYLYIGIRTGRLLAYAIFIALFVNNSIIGPVLLIFYNLIHGAVALFLDIFQTGFYLLTRVIENILLIVAAILSLVIFGFADNDSLSHTGFQNLGYGLSTVFVLMIINGSVRFFYLLYKKVQQWSLGTYDVGEKGELVNYDDKQVLPQEPPQSDRNDQK